MASVTHKVVVVGGGVMGASIAYHLACEGWTDVILLEKGELTGGSTWHAAGQCPNFVGNYTMAKINHYSTLLYPQLEQLTGQPAGWHACGGIRIATTPEEVDWFNHVAGFGKTIGFPIEIIDPKGISELNPWLNLDGIIAGAYTPMDGHVDPASATNAMAQGARNLGVTIRRHTLVKDIKRRSSGEFEVHTADDIYVCEHVINAGGCYAGEISAWVGVSTPITNMEHHYLVTDPLEAFKNATRELPIMRDPATAGYYRQEQRAGLIGIYEHVGSKEAWAQTGGIPDWRSENELFEGDLDRIAPWLEKAMQRMPIFAEAGIKRVINGAIGHSPDGYPLVGPVVGVPNFWQCCGSSSAVAQGPGCGKYLAQLMVHGDSDINMRGLDPRRFGDYADSDYCRAKSFDDYHHMFQTPLPGREDPAGRPNRVTPLYESLAEKGAVYTESFGWERPKYFVEDGREEKLQFRRNNIFDLIGQECQAVRERVGIMDFSSFAKFVVSGPGSMEFLDRLTSNKLAKKAGGIRLTYALSPNGRILGEWTVTKLGDETFYVIAGASAELETLALLEQSLPEGVTVQNVSDDYGVLLLAGPKARHVLRTVTSASLDNAAFPWLTGQEITVAGVKVLALRVTYVGELGWELHVPIADLKTVYDAIWKAGRTHGIRDFGIIAVNSLRMEKAYLGFGTELTNELTLIEAQAEHFFAPTKGDFVGRDATRAKLSTGCKAKIIYGEVDAFDCDVQGGEPLLHGDQVVGVCTSGAYGHHTGKSLAFVFAQPEFIQDLDLLILGVRRKFSVLTEPVWDPTSDRQKADG